MLRPRQFGKHAFLQAEASILGGIIRMASAGLVTVQVSCVLYPETSRKLPPRAFSIIRQKEHLGSAARRALLRRGEAMYCWVRPSRAAGQHRAHISRNRRHVAHRCRAHRHIEMSSTGKSLSSGL